MVNLLVRALSLGVSTLLFVTAASAVPVHPPPVQQHGQSALYPNGHSLGYAAAGYGAGYGYQPMVSGQYAPVIPHTPSPDLPQQPHWPSVPSHAHAAGLSGYGPPAVVHHPVHPASDPIPGHAHAPVSRSGYGVLPPVVAHHLVHPTSDRHTQIQALVQAHSDAAHAHAKAQKAHLEAEAAHKEAAARHLAQNYGFGYRMHTNAAQAHAEAAAFHADRSRMHQQAMQHVHAPNAAELHLANQNIAYARGKKHAADESKGHAIAAKEHLDAASGHDALAEAYKSQGGHRGAFLARYHAAQAQGHRNDAYFHEPGSEHPLPVGQSIEKARISRQKAEETRSRIGQGHVYQPKPKHVPGSGKFDHVLHQ